MCVTCDYAAGEVVWCEICQQNYDRPCPRCGGQRGCPKGHNSGVDCFWCATGLGPGEHFDEVEVRPLPEVTE